MTSWMSLVPRIARTRSPVATFWKTVAEKPLLSENGPSGWPVLS
jgi:hypothetical protein